MAKEINSDLIRGNINTIILKALYDGDRYGYDIVRDIEIKSHGQYTIKQPTLYSCLKRLESQGFVSSYWGTQSNGGRRKYFSLTEMGREVFKQSQDDYEYSRTIIDKLISEGRYDLGDYTPTDVEDLESEASDVVHDQIENEIENPFLTSSVDNPEPKSTIETVVSDDKIANQSEQIELVNAEENIPAASIDNNSIDAIDFTNDNALKGDTFFIPEGAFTNTDTDDDFLSYIRVAEDKSSDYFIDDSESDMVDDFANISSSIETIDENVYSMPNAEDEMQLDSSIVAQDSLVEQSDCLATVESAASENEQIVMADPQIQPEIVDNSNDVAAMLNASYSGNSYITNIESTEPEENSNSFSSLYSSELNKSFDNDESLFGSGSGIPSSTSFDSTFVADGYEEESIEENFVSDTKNDAKFLSPDFGSMTNQPKEEKSSDFLSYNQSDDKFSQGEAEKAPTNEYQSALGDLIENFTSANQNQIQENISIKSDEIDNKIQIRTFGSTIIESARELGEEVKVRTHDSNTQEMYAARFYYRDNFLRMFINAILLIVILAESFIFYTIAKNAIGSTGKFDSIVYIAAIVIAFILPIYAAIKYWLNPNSKKRLDSGDVSNLKFRIVVMVLLCLLIFLLHLYLGMPLSGNISEYVVSMFLPMILTTNLPLSSGIFMLMYKSPFFVIKDR